MKMLTIIVMTLLTNTVLAGPLYFCTGANSPYFDKLLNLIGSIHATNYDNLAEIAVFDLGLEQFQINQLKTMEKVTLYSLQKTHPDLLKYFQLRNGYTVFGWYAWKPVIIKQALDKFPYVVWVDAGTTILKPIDDLFNYIQESGYFICTIGNENDDGKWRHPVGWSATQFLKNTFNLNSLGRRWILAQESVMGGVIGVARDSLFYHHFLMTLYERTKDLRYFADDGTSSGGMGAGRHDQTIMSIMAYLNSWHVLKQDYTQETPIYLNIGQTRVPFYITWDPNYVCDKTHIYSSRSDLRNKQHNILKIKYKK